MDATMYQLVNVTIWWLENVGNEQLTNVAMYQLGLLEFGGFGNVTMN